MSGMCARVCYEINVFCSNQSEKSEFIYNSSARSKHVFLMAQIKINKTMESIEHCIEYLSVFFSEVAHHIPFALLPIFHC